MDKIETPENEEILKFLNDLADYCIPMDGGKMRMRAQVWPIVKARDALLRADERQKAAERAMKWGAYRLCNYIEKPGLYAAIMAEPEEAQG